MSIEIEYEDSKGNALCFKHAVGAVILNNEDIKITAVDTSTYMDSTGYLGRICVECYPEE